MANPSDTMSVLKNYRVGLNNVGSYQVAGKPYITGSDAGPVGGESYYAFPSVTNNITVTNYSVLDTALPNQRQCEEIRVHFNSTGSSAVVAGHHYYILSGTVQSIDLNVKCKEIYILDYFRYGNRLRRHLSLKNAMLVSRNIDRII